MKNDKCNCVCSCDCQRMIHDDQEIRASIPPENIAGGSLVASGPVSVVSPDVFAAIDHLGGELTPQQWHDYGLDKPLADQPDTEKCPEVQSATKRDQTRQRGPEAKGEGDPADDRSREKAPCKRTCRWIVTFSSQPRSAREDGEGTLNVSRRSWKETDGPGTKHHIWATTKGGNCLTEEWSKTVTAAGLIMFRWRLACRIEEDSGPCPECTATGRVEALYRCHVLAFTWEGALCPIGTRRSQGLAAQWAIFDVNDHRVFTDSVGAQSGDEIATTIQTTIGTELSGEEGKFGGKISGSISSSETRNEKSGEAKDRLNITGGRDIGIKGHAVLRTGAKANITTGGRAGGWAFSHTDSVGLYGIVDSDCAQKAIFAWFAGVLDEDVEDTRRIMKEFFEHHGFTNHPF